MSLPLGTAKRQLERAANERYYVKTAQGTENTIRFGVDRAAYDAATEVAEAEGR